MSAELITRIAPPYLLRSGSCSAIAGAAFGASMNSVTLTGHLYQPPSGGKHLLQYTQNFPQRRLRERTEAPHQTLLIHRADLVQHHMTVSFRANRQGTRNGYGCPPVVS